MTENVEVDAMLSVFAYGHNVKVVINGLDVGVTGGKSENKRLFTKDDPQAKEAPPEIRQKFFVLNEGENRIVIEFSKGTGFGSTMDVSFVLEGYPAPVFLLNSSSKEPGKVEKTFVVQKSPPDGFKPIYVSDAGDDRAAYVYVAPSDCSVTPSLNGKEQTRQSISGVTPLVGAIVGKNEVVVTYKCKSGSKDDLKFAILTPQGTKYYSRKITDALEHKESFEFTAK